MREPQVSLKYLANTASTAPRDNDRTRTLMLEGTVVGLEIETQRHRVHGKMAGDR